MATGPVFTKRRRTDQLGRLQFINECIRCQINGRIKDTESEGEQSESDDKYLLSGGPKTKTAKSSTQSKVLTQVPIRNQENHEEDIGSAGGEEQEEDPPDGEIETGEDQLVEPGNEPLRETAAVTSGASFAPNMEVFQRSPRR